MSTVDEPALFTPTNQVDNLPTLRTETSWTTESTVEDVTPQITASGIAYETPWLKVIFSRTTPALTFLSVDATGAGNHQRNLLKSPCDGPTSSSEVCPANGGGGKVSVQNNSVSYADFPLGDPDTASLGFTVHPKKLVIRLNRKSGQTSDTNNNRLFRFIFDATVTPVSPLGRIRDGEPGILVFPMLLHFPDCGSLLVRNTKIEDCDPVWKFSLSRDLTPIRPGAVAAWRGMTPDERKQTEKTGNRHLLQLNAKGDADPEGKGALHIGPEEIQLDLLADGSATERQVEFEMTVTAVYPEPTLVDADPALSGIKKAWLNIFGFRADLGCLANNSTGDTCQFCIYCYADQAAETPPLFDDFTALDLVRMSLDRYFDGFKGYSDHFQDVAPSTIIAAWIYAIRKPDTEWLRRRIPDIEAYAERIIAQDTDGDGLCESPNGPTNWWDNIKWNGKDAYSSALCWRAFRCAADLERRLGNTVQATLYLDRANRIKGVFYSTFYNPKTGVLAGWRTLDGELRDSYFLWANGIAISYGLVGGAEAHRILDRLQSKIKEVGFNSFHFGLPGNLEPFPHYLDFQLYENGGVTGSMAYHYLQALYTMDRHAEADAIFDAMLEGYRRGTFQNGVGNGGDWKEWDGTPCGYEGMLVDAYYPLTAWITGRLGRGIWIP